MSGKPRHFTIGFQGQWDILEFSRNADHVSPNFPDGYWPEGDAPPDAGSWDNSVQSFREDLQAMIDLVSNPQTDLFRPIPHGNGQTVCVRHYLPPITMRTTLAS